MDDFLGKSLLEMKVVKPNVELLPVSFKSSFADCYDMYFTGVLGARIYAKFLRPKKTSANAPLCWRFMGIR